MNAAIFSPHKFKEQSSVQNKIIKNILDQSTLRQPHTLNDIVQAQIDQSG